LATGKEGSVGAGFNENIKWASDNSKVTVNNGVVTLADGAGAEMVKLTATFEVNGKVYTVNVADYTVKVEEGVLNLEPEPWQSDSSLGTVMLNGFEVEGFESDKTEYTVERFWKTDELVIEALTQSPTATAEVTWDGKCPGTVTIVVTSGDKNSTTTYTLKLTNDKGLLPIYGAISDPYDPAEPIEFTYDSFVADDGGTDTWALKNCPSATYDLGKLVDLAKIDVAFNYSRKRGTYYDLYISEDGENWTLIDRKDDKTGASPITTTGKFNDYVTIWDTPVTARYVRIHIRGNTEGTGKYDNNNAYGSIQEISFYGTYANTVNPDEGDTGETEGGNTGETEGGNIGETEGGNTGETESGTTGETESGTTSGSGNGNAGGSGNGNAGDDVETGDTSRVWLWTLLMAITLMSGYAMLMLKKERE
jgi:hypothetical protein